MKKEYKEMQDFIDDVHAEISIDEILVDMGIISRSDFKGQFVQCMFHDGDNSPSLQITESFWKCYGCGLKGDIFAFIQQYYNTDFIEAVKKLSDFLNINISNIKWKFDAKYAKLKDEWNKFKKDMEEAPEEIQSLKRDYFPQEIGYDKAINYIVLPLTSKTGAVLGFTKRRVDSDISKPKWKHSSVKDSMISQCHNVFNLFNASPEIRKKKTAISTEGPKDVIAYQRIGLNNTFCVCGTSNSANVWDLIFPVKNIILSYDLDHAGIEATIKTLVYLTPIFDIKNVESVILPDDADPYDVITNEGNDSLLKCYNARIPAVDFLLRYGTVDDVKNLYDGTPDYNKIYIMKSICKIKGFNISEAESWLNSSNEKDKSTVKKNEKEQLLAFVNGEDCDDVPMMDIDKAKRILKLKYNIE